jgi:hypothetical protein
MEEYKKFSEFKNRDRTLSKPMRIKIERISNLPGQNMPFPSAA